MIKLGKLKISYERGRQVLLFLFCLFLAFIIWCIHKLSADYSIYLNYRVNVSTNLEGRSEGSFSDNLLTVKGKASGIYILQQRYINDMGTIFIDIDKRYIKRVPSVKDGYYILCRDIKDKLSENLSENLEIETLSVDTLFFNFPHQINRKVPLAPSYSATFKDQYMAVGKMKLNPNSVTVYGNLSLIENIDTIRTENLNFENLESTKNGVVALKKIDGVRFSCKEVYYTFEVERYIEKTVTLHVEVVNAPQDKEINIFPSEVKMTFRIPFKSDQKATGEDYKLNVDYDDIINSINSYVEPKLERKPGEMISYSLEPQFVECRIVERQHK